MTSVGGSLLTFAAALLCGGFLCSRWPLAEGASLTESKNLLGLHLGFEGVFSTCGGKYSEHCLLGGGGGAGSVPGLS